jgi:hypothetical protein
MKNKVIISTILFVLVLAFSFYVFSKEKDESRLLAKEEAQSESQIILFYGDGCPHCAIVEEHIKENKFDEKIAFSQKEIYNNRANAKELEKKAEICGIPTDSIGVPFLWDGDGEKCLIGDEDIVNFFEQKINTQ